MIELFEDLNPPQRLLMGPGPINAHPRVLQAMSAPLLGQFDPQFREYMKQTSALYRGVFQTANRWTLLVDGTARAGIEAALASLIEPGDRVLVPIFGRPPSLILKPPGCSFHPRCPYVREAHKRVDPRLENAGGGDPGHAVACRSRCQGCDRHSVQHRKSTDQHACGVQRGGQSAAR